MSSTLPRNGLRSGDLAFALAGVLVIVGALFVGARLPAWDAPHAIALGVTADLTLMLPAAFYLLVARPRGWSPAAAIPIVIAGFVVAKVGLPTGFHAPLRVVELVLVPLELAILALVALRVRRAVRVAPGGGELDSLERLRRVAREVVPAPRLAGALAGELAIFDFALASWRRCPHVPSGTRAISTHRRSNHGPIVFALVLLSLGEVAAVHLLLGLWSTAAAWIATGLSVYGVLWLVADYRATVLRPVLVGGEELRVRAGLRWEVQVPRALVAEVRGEEPRELSPRLSTAFLARPNTWLVLSEPVTVSGPLGVRRRARAIGLSLDRSL